MTVLVNYSVAGAGNLVTYSSGSSVVVDGVTYDLVANPVNLLAAVNTNVSSTTTGADDVLGSFTIPAGTLGVNSILQIEPCWDYTSSANNKILKVIVGGTTVLSRTRTTSLRDAPLVVLANRNSLTSQINVYDGQTGYVAAAANGSTTHAIDFSAAVTVQITGQRASGADTLTLSYFRILHFTA